MDRAMTTPGPTTGSANQKSLGTRPLSMARCITFAKQLEAAQKIASPTPMRQLQRK